MASLIRFCTLVLICSLFVQQIQFKRIENQQIAAWHQFKLEYETRKSDAALPAAFALAAPHVLAALVVGTGFFWCYTHGGKEAWYQFTGAVIDGVNVTKQWLQEKIAQNNGINTTGSSNPDNWTTMSSGDHVYFDLESEEVHLMNSDGKYYSLYHYSATYSANWSPSPGYVYPLDFSAGRISVIVVTSRTKPGAGYWRARYQYLPNTFTSDPFDFNPSDYPELYTGPALLSNCHQVAQQYPNLSLLYTPLDSAPPEANSQNTITQSISAATADGGVIDDKGQLLPPPPVMPDLPLPELDSGVGWIDLNIPGSGPVAVPGPAADDINGIIGAGGKVDGLTHVGGNTAAPALQWTDADGKTHVTPIEQVLAQQIAQSVPVINNASASASVITTPDLPEVIPNLPSGVDPPVFDDSDFDSEVDWGEEEPWPWADWLDRIPFLNTLNESGLQLSGANSLFSTELTLLGKTKTISFNFAQYSSIYNAMGLILLGCSGWLALRLAITKRD